MSDQLAVLRRSKRLTPGDQQQQAAAQAGHVDRLNPRWIQRQKRVHQGGGEIVWHISCQTRFNSARQRAALRSVGDGKAYRETTCQFLTILPIVRMQRTARLNFFQQALKIRA